MLPLDGIIVVTLEHADRGPFLHAATWPTWARVLSRSNVPAVATLPGLTMNACAGWLRTSFGAIGRRKA